jgi:hypothetical protein
MVVITEIYISTNGTVGFASITQIRTFFPPRNHSRLLTLYPPHFIRQSLTVDDNIRLHYIFLSYKIRFFFTFLQATKALRDSRGISLLCFKPLR